MKLELLLLSVALFKMCSSFKIMFHCGKEVDFPDCFWEVFQVSPQEDPEKAKQVSHYFPLHFTDFAIFLYRTKVIERKVIDSDTYPVYSTLCKLVKTELFQDFFLKYNVGTLSRTAKKDQATLDYPDDLRKRNEARFEFYAKWWSENNYLYPFILKSDLEVENVVISMGFYNYFYRVKSVLIDSDKLSIKLPQKIVLKTSKFNFGYSQRKHSLSITSSIDKLKFSLFFGLHECPNIHLHNCAVLDIQSDEIITGFLCEEAEYSDIWRFVYNYQILGNYSVLLKEFIKVAEAIQFLHQREILHGDVYIDNILVYSDGNEISIKLGGFKLSKKFSSINPEGLKKHYGTQVYSSSDGSTSDFPSSITLESLMEMDWSMYLDLIEQIILSNSLNLSSKPEFNGIKKLLELAQRFQYWKDENGLKRVLEDIKKHLNEDIEACQTEEQFQLVRK